MFVVSENTTTCLRGNDYVDVKTFLNDIKEEGWGAVMSEICTQTIAAIENGEWIEQSGFCSITVCVKSTNFGVHIAEC